MKIYKTLLIAGAALAIMTALVSCSKDDKSSSDDFNIQPADSLSQSENDPFDVNPEDDPANKVTSVTPLETRVYDDMESAYLEYALGDEARWEKNHEDMYAMLTDGLGYDKTDTDGDSLPDDFEIEFLKTDPENPDTDGDGYDDCVEYWMKTDPNTPN